MPIVIYVVVSSDTNGWFTSATHHLKEIKGHNDGNLKLKFFFVLLYYFAGLAGCQFTHVSLLSQERALKWLYDFFTQNVYVNINKNVFNKLLVDGSGSDDIITSDKVKSTFLNGYYQFDLLTLSNVIFPILQNFKMNLL